VTTVEIIMVRLFLEGYLFQPYAIIGEAADGERYILNRYPTRTDARKAITAYQETLSILNPMKVVPLALFGEREPWKDLLS